MHWVFTKITHKIYGRTVSLFNLYVPVLHAEKIDCWNSLESYLNLKQPENIIVAGDLNITLDANEKKGDLLLGIQQGNGLKTLSLAGTLSI